MDINEMTKNQLLDHPVVSQLIRDQNKQTYEDYKKERDRADSLQGQLTQKDTELAAANDKLKAAGAALSKDKVTEVATATLENAKINSEDKDLILKKVSSQATLFDPNADNFDDLVKASVEAEVTHTEALYKRLGIEVEGKGSNKTDETDNTEDKGGDTDQGGTNDNTGDGDDFLDSNPVKTSAA